MKVFQGNAFKVMAYLKLLVSEKKTAKKQLQGLQKYTNQSFNQKFLKNLKNDSSKTDYSLMKTCSDLQRQKHLNPEIINTAKKIYDMFTDDDMEIHEKAVDKMVKLVNTTSSKLQQPERMKKALDVLQTEGPMGLEFTGFREKVN